MPYKQPIHFGTDGVRGVANESLRPEHVLRLGVAFGRYLLSKGEVRPIVLGCDPRLSSRMFVAAFEAGICSVGLDVLDAGIVSSPALAFMADHLEVCGGAMVTASHNPADHNGVKLFDAHGQKLTAAAEIEVEALANSPDDSHRARPDGVGAIHSLRDPLKAYVDMLRTSIDGATFDGLRVVVDTGNGAASRYAGSLLQELGAEVIERNHDPNGRNINVGCGAMCPQGVRGDLLAAAADIAVCLDGDADRVMFLDERGAILDGDHVKYIWTRHAVETDRLPNTIVVGTLMSNLGLERALAGLGCTLVRTLVGDRYVYERMVEMGAVIGGEQSGHIIFRDYARTGDGLLSALQLLRIMKDTGQLLSTLAAPMVKLPQVMRNVPLRSSEDWRTPEATAIMAECEARLDGCGRILVRESGTEPLLRVMCECDDAELAVRVVDELAGFFAESPHALPAVRK